MYRKMNWQERLNTSTFIQLRLIRNWSYSYNRPNLKECMCSGAHLDDCDKVAWGFKGHRSWTETRNTTWGEPASQMKVFFLGF